MRLSATGDPRDLPWFYPVLIDVAVITPFALVFTFDTSRQTGLRVLVGFLYLLLQIGVIIFMMCTSRARTKRARHRKGRVPPPRR